jgi:hypothetical protein
VAHQVTVVGLGQHGAAPADRSSRRLSSSGDLRELFSIDRLEICRDVSDGNARRQLGGWAIDHRRHNWGIAQDAREPARLPPGHQEGARCLPWFEATPALEAARGD